MKAARRVLPGAHCTFWPAFLSVLKQIYNVMAAQAATHGKYQSTRW
jgi:hypothetical protein